MAPKEAYKVYSLNQHIEDTKKGLSAEAKNKPRPSQRLVAATAKKEPASAIFGNNNDDSESSDSSSDSSGDEGGENLLKKVIATTSIRPVTKVPVPASTPKGRSKPEEIADSDVERSAAAKKTAVKKSRAPATKVSSTSSSSSEAEETSSETSSESELEESNPKPKANGASVKAAAAFIKDKASSSSSEEEESSSEEEEEEEEEEESDDEESSDDKKTQKPAAKQTPVAPPKKATTTKQDAAKKTTTKRKESSSSSEEESSEEESSEAPAAVAKPAKKKLSEPKVVESASSESDDSDHEHHRVDESMHMSDREGDHRAAAALSNIIGSDFVLRKSGDSANGQDVAKILNEANLQGKQFWYFTVPSNVPISVVQNLEIPMDRAQSGDRIFSHDGQDFGISFDSVAPKSTIQILIPSGNNSDYRATHHPIDQSMHVKRITQLGGASSSTSGPAAGRAPRPQPKGLKARYQPFGVSSPMGNIGEDAPVVETRDVEMAEASAAASRATPVAKHGVNGKKKQAAEANASDAARKGKRKHTASEEDAAAAAEQLQGEIQSAAKKQKKQKKQKGRVGSPDLGSEPPSAVKTQTPIAPPTIPRASYSFSSLDSGPAAASTPPPKSALSAAAVDETGKKSAKKVKLETPLPDRSQTQPPGGTKQTPIPLPGRHSAVPLPVMLSSSSKSREASTAVPVPVTPSQAKSKKTKHETIPSSQQEPPPSTQPAEKAKKTSTKSKAQQD